MIYLGPVHETLCYEAAVGGDDRPLQQAGGRPHPPNKIILDINLFTSLKNIYILYSSEYFL